MFTIFGKIVDGLIFIVLLAVLVYFGWALIIGAFSAVGVIAPVIIIAWIIFKRIRKKFKKEES